MKYIYFFILFVACTMTRGAEQVVIERSANPSQVIPISISGISGLAHDVVRFDLEVAGFEFVNADRAMFHISGKADGSLVGVLTDKNKSPLINRTYRDRDMRILAHAFADDIIQTLTGRRGISHLSLTFRVEQGRNSEIYIADFDGHNAVPVTRDQSLATTPTWVPGQRKLFYTSYRSGYPDIILHDLGTGQRQVFSREGGSNFSPAVSPDGSRVAMILTKGGSPDVYIKNFDGTGLKQLTRTREDESSPCWSPDGKSICYVSRFGGRPALFVVAAEGGEPRRISTVGALNITEPDWSPDGKTIAFTSQMGDFNICTVPASGGEARIIVAGEDPAWAPNSRTIAFTRRKSGSRVLSLLDVPTKRVKDIRQVSGGCSQPSWERPGGKTVTTSTINVQ